MDKIDRGIINEIQSDFPVTSEPFRELGERFNISEDEVIQRLKTLKAKGIIRRIGANFDSRTLGFTSTLCAARVPEKKLDEFVKTVNNYPGVTHNYLRKHIYNVWFTFIAQDMTMIENALEDISDMTGVDDILNLPAVRMFKIKVDFEV